MFKRLLHTTLLSLTLVAASFAALPAVAADPPPSMQGENFFDSTLQELKTQPCSSQQLRPLSSRPSTLE